TILMSVFFIGIGSATFHPEGSRVAYLAAGPRRGLSQSIFQVGGNAGQALAPVITALILVPLGQFGAIWFTLVAFIAVLCLLFIAKWYRKMVQAQQKQPGPQQDSSSTGPKKSIIYALLLLIFLVFARTWYQKAISNFYQFYAIETYCLSISQAHLYIFSFFLAGAVGTFLGVPLADRFGKQNIILCSLVGPAPFTILLPFVSEWLAIVFLCIIGILLMSSFSVTVVYAQELVPGKIGTMSGLIVGLAFGMGAIGTVVLGSIIDKQGLMFTMIGISLLPLLGFLTFLLPTDQKVKHWYQNAL